MKALVLDDSSLQRTAIRKILEEIGYDVTEAAGALQALYYLKAGYSPDIALVDWNMPKITGLEFVREVRCNEQYDDIRIMMVTTETDMKHVPSALEVGANEYMMKPFTKEGLLEKLQTLVSTLKRNNERQPA